MALAAALALTNVSPARGAEEVPPAPAEEAAPEAPAEGAAPAGPAAEAEAPAAEKTVKMAEFIFHGRKVRGAIVAEDNTTVHIRAPGGGTTGYPIKDAADLKRFTVTESEYAEERADSYYETAWEAADPAAALAQARGHYRQALALTTSAERAAPLNRKLDALATEVEERHKEALREQELKRAALETELIELERNLTRQKLKSLSEHEQAITQLQKTILALQERNQALLARIEDLKDDLEEVEEDVEDIEERNKTYITRTVFIDLNRGQDELKDELEKLRKRIRKLEENAD